MVLQATCSHATDGDTTPGGPCPNASGTGWRCELLYAATPAAQPTPRPMRILAVGWRWIVGRHRGAVERSRRCGLRLPSLHDPATVLLEATVVATDGRCRALHRSCFTLDTEAWFDAGHPDPGPALASPTRRLSDGGPLRSQLPRDPSTDELIDWYLRQVERSIRAIEKGVASDDAGELLLQARMIAETAHAYGFSDLARCAAALHADLTVTRCIAASYPHIAELVALAVRLTAAA